MSSTAPTHPTLSLTSILLGSLPATLTTATEPERYTVEAIFSRAPLPKEVAAIRGPETRAALAREGFPDVELGVSDRRLRIGHTNLAELQNGLAAIVAEQLEAISTSVSDDRNAIAQGLIDAAARESERSAQVKALASAVHFTPRSQPSREHADRSADWDNEGGQ